jgi:hypothetical protein
MNWLAVNKVLAFVGPRFRAAYASLTPVSLALISAMKRFWTGEYVDASMVLAFIFYAGATAAYSLARLVHHLSCPLPIRNIEDQAIFLEHKRQVLNQVTEYVSKLRELVKEEIETVATGPDKLTKDEASRVADALARRMVSHTDYLEETAYRMEDYNQNEPQLIVCVGLLIVCGVFSLTSVVAVMISAARPFLGSLHP